MLDKADSELGCDSGDAKCLCENVNFTYGIRDCSLNLCKDQAEAIIHYGSEYCLSKSHPRQPYPFPIVYMLMITTDEGGVVITTATGAPSAVSEITADRDLFLGRWNRP